jgi:hypothetical protein
MESAISAILGELISRAISFLVNKCSDKDSMDQKLEKLQQLLLRIHAVVEEADGRYVTNPMMLMQLKTLADSMYKGYHVLDKFRYKSITKSFIYEEGTASTSIPLKRSRTITGTMKCCAQDNDLQTVLENLERALANMTEFVLLLVGCERICRRPYDTYLYTDTLMFGRHAEKQQIINVLLNDPGNHGGPTVLPVIGGCRVGKKTLVSHACKNDRVQSSFSSILYIRGDSMWRMEHADFSNERILAVVEFLTDVDDDDWVRFYTTVRHKAAEGSKVVIISRILNLARLGTVKAVFLNSLSDEEYRYLFKRLSFGSTDENEFPYLASMANEVAVVLGGSLVTANVIADQLRKNLDIQFWLRILRRFKGVVDKNLSKYGEHPKEMLDNERPIDITALNYSSSAAARLMPPRVEGDDCPKRKLTHIPFGELIAGDISAPNDEFVVSTWESRIAPYTRYVNDCCCPQDQLGPRTSSRKRRPSS